MVTLDASPWGSYYYALLLPFRQIRFEFPTEITQKELIILIATVTTTATVMQRGDTPKIKDLWNTYKGKNENKILINVFTERNHLLATL